ncbi:MAG: hypothetical protein MN733_37675 [Nitrososphaera sp.]|nr:hypothetical protein [Nitrososphaera sp.]
MNEIDDYGLRYLIEHLVRAERVTDALSIIKPDFREVKHRRFGSDFGFVRDLEIIINCLEDHGQLDDLPAIIRCSLIYSLLTSLAHRLPAEVLSTLVWFGESERAIESASLSPRSKEKAEQFLTVVKALRQSGANPEKTEHILQETLQITRSLTQAAEGTTDLLKAEIAKQAAHLNWEWCRQILGEIENLNVRDRSKIWVAGEVAEDEIKAIELLREVVSTITRDSPLIWDFSIALAQIAQHHLETVESFIESIEGQHHQDLVRREIAKHLLENDYVDSALSIVKKIKAPIRPMTVIGDIIAHLAKQDVKKVYLLLDDLPFVKEDAQPLLNFIEALSLEHVDYALQTADRLVDPSKKCQALAQVALIFARGHNITEAWKYLKAAYDLVRQLPSSDVALVALHLTIGEIIAETARINEHIAAEMIAEWESTELGQYISSQACQLLLDYDVGLTLQLAELIPHPYLKGILLAQAIFRLSDNDPRVSTLQDQVRELAGNDILTEEQVRQLQAYLLTSEGLDVPEHLLSIWDDETEPVEPGMGLPTKITINYSDGPDPADEKTKQRDNILIDLALNVIHRNVDQALIVLQATHPANRTRGLAQLAQVLNQRTKWSSPDTKSHSLLSQHKSFSSDDVLVSVAQLAKRDIQLTSKIVEAFPNRLDQAKAYAAIALALKDQGDKGQLFKERAILVSQMSPAAALKAIAYGCVNDILKGSLR